MMRRLMAHFEVTSDEVRVPANNFYAIRYVLALFVLYSHSFGLLVLPYLSRVYLHLLLAPWLLNVFLR